MYIFIHIYKVKLSKKGISIGSCWGTGGLPFNTTVKRQTNYSHYYTSITSSTGYVTDPNHSTNEKDREV